MKEQVMASSPRKVIDCRDYPSEKNCTLAISGAEDEVLETAVLHAASVHGHKNTPELREQLRSMLKDEGEAKATKA
jgi:predicted small metal-binding protein